MKVRDICDIRPSVFLKESYLVNVFITDDSKVAKVFNLDYLDMLKKHGFDIEAKVLNGSQFVNSKGIVVPDEAIYDGENFVGYMMPYIKGKKFGNYNTSISGNIDLYEYACDFKKLEDIIKSENKIVFPDLCSKGNIIIDQNNNFKLIDFDGFQIDKYLSNVITSSYGSRTKFFNTKYHNKDYSSNVVSNNPHDVYSFTKNLDIKSLIYLYVGHVFGINLSSLDSFDNRFEEDLESIIHTCCLNKELVDKIKMLYLSNEDNCYLGETMFDIAFNYNLEPIAIYNGVVRRLVKK